MKFRILYLFVCFGVFSCSKQEARRPISATSSGLLESTTSLLKKINTIEEIKDAKHDIFLSSEPVRKNAFEKVFSWLDKD